MVFLEILVKPTIWTECLKKNLCLDHVILIDVPDEDLVARCTGRLLCDTCDYIGNTDKGEKVGDKCPVAEGTLYQRDDDKEETVRNRLKVYHEQTSPIINFYEKRDFKEIRWW